MTLDERMLAAELRNCRFGLLSKAANFVCDIHAMPAGYELSDRQRAYLFHLGHRYRKQLPEFLAERSEEFRQLADDIYARSQTAAAQTPAPQTARNGQSPAVVDCTPQMPLFAGGVRG